MSRSLLKGRSVLQDPFHNKGLAFSQEERKRLELDGLLESKVESLDDQLDRLNMQYARIQNDLDRNTFLMNVLDRNKVLFFAFVSQDIKKYLPIVYTPVVGESVKNFSRQLLDTHGLILSIDEKDSLDTVLSRCAKSYDVDLIIVTDGEAVLGIGDWGVGGLDISIGKLAVYTICGGVDPRRVLPVVLDVGTDNQTLFDSKYYVGLKQKRVRGQAYDAFIDAFVTSVKRHFKNVYLHWEDFGIGNARRILEKYQSTMCTFNDDLQGTALITLANLLAASKVANMDLKEHKILLFGAGTAGVGIVDRIVGTMVLHGADEQQARSCIWLVDRQGLLVEGDENLLDFQKPYARGVKELDDMRRQLGNSGAMQLEDVVRYVKPTVLMGTSTVMGAFTETIVKIMSDHTDRPIIFPLSNPTSLSEATPFDLIHWSQGRALIATGSPFDDVVYAGKTFQISQSNNAFAFPGLGLGVMVSKARRVTDNMLYQVCLTLAKSSPVHQNIDAPLLDDISKTPEISKKIALAVAKAARVDGVSGVSSDVDFEKAVEAAFWYPSYQSMDNDA